MIVSNTLPITMSAVKTGFGQTGTKTLREFLAGGGIVDSNAFGVNGLVPSSGTIELTDLRGATYSNLKFAGGGTANGRITLSVQGYENLSCESDTGIYIYANTAASPAQCGNLVVTCYTSGQESVLYNNNVTATAGDTGFGGEIVPNQWLQGTIRPIDTSLLTGTYLDILWNPRVIQTGSGRSVGFTGFTANTWIPINGANNFSIYASSSTINDQSYTARYEGYLAIRRRSDNVVLSNSYVELYAQAASYSGPPN